MLLIYFIYIIK